MQRWQRNVTSVWPPALFLCGGRYCAGNELYPADKSPSPDIAAALPSIIAQVDTRTVPYVASSMTNYTAFDPVAALAPADGPYGMLDER